VEKFSPILNNNYPTETYNTSITLTVTANASSFTIAPNATLGSLTVIENAASSDQLTLSNATSFKATALTSTAVTAISGDVTQLSSWVAAALTTTNAGNLVQHGIAWFTFDNNTYLLEQANTKGTAYGSGDTLIELVGVHNEATATFNATTHVLTL
jgi:predicted RecA/RadA family phage recombinase